MEKISSRYVQRMGLRDRVLKLLAVKSIVTLALTWGFLYLVVKERIAADSFLTIFTTVVSFFFGTQSERMERKKENDEDRK